jgi:hypothetical protein
MLTRTPSCPSLITMSSLWTISVNHHLSPKPKPTAKTPFGKNKSGDTQINFSSKEFPHSVQNPWGKKKKRTKKTNKKQQFTSFPPATEWTNRLTTHNGKYLRFLWPFSLTIGRARRPRTSTSLVEKMTISRPLLVVFTMSYSRSS